MNSDMNNGMNRLGIKKTTCMYKLEKWDKKENKVEFMHFA